MGPTGYFSSCGLWNRREDGHSNEFQVSNEFHLSWRMRFSFTRVWNTTHQGFGDISSRCNILAVFLIGDTHSLLGWHFWETSWSLLNCYKIRYNWTTTKPNWRGRDETILSACDVRLSHRAVWLVPVHHVICQMNKHRKTHFFFFQRRRTAIPLIIFFFDFRLVVKSVVSSF